MTWIKKSLFVFGVFLCSALYVLAWTVRSYPPDSILTKPFAIFLLAVALSLFLLAVKFVALRTVFTPIIAILLSLSIAEEISARYLGTGQTYFEATEEINQNYRKRVEGFGYHPHPGSYNIKKLTSDGEIIYDVVYSIADDGYRQELISEPFDAYIFGGSFVFGEGLNNDETVSAFLSSEHGIKTKNVGMHGYGLHQALYNIQNGITSVNGINILLTAPWHASRSACTPSWARGTFRYQISDGLAILNGVCPGGYFLHRILGKSFFYQLFVEARQDFTIKLSDSEIELYLAIINTIYQESLKNNSSLVIAYIDDTEEALSNTNWTNKSLIKQMEKLSDSVIDVTLVDKVEQLAPKFYLHNLDRHPSALANQLRAALISDHLKK
ncbi:MAG: hypothetical protein ACJZ8Q_03180 [Paracoccaceae bacterium]